MPPASLSTFEVIRPGPSTANSNARRRQVWRPRRCTLTAFWRHFSTRSLIVVKFISLFATACFYKWARRRVTTSSTAITPGAAVRIHHAQGAQVVLVKKLENLFFVGVRWHRNQRLG